MLRDMSRSSVVRVTAWTLLVAALVVCLLPKPVQGRDISRRQPHAPRRPEKGPTPSSTLTDRSQPHRRRQPELPGVVTESRRCTGKEHEPVARPTWPTSRFLDLASNASRARGRSAPGYTN